MNRNLRNQAVEKGDFRARADAVNDLTLLLVSQRQVPTPAHIAYIYTNLQISICISIAYIYTYIHISIYISIYLSIYLDIYIYNVYKCICIFALPCTVCYLLYMMYTIYDVSHICIQFGIVSGIVKVPGARAARGML